MAIKVKPTRAFTEAFEDLMPTAATMRAAGEELSVKIVNRTLDGVSETGAPFAPYAHGRSKFGRTTPDLHQSGAMLSDLKVVEATKRRFRLGFASARARKLAALHTTGTVNMPARPFLGVDPRWIDDVVRKVFRRGR
jgi:hypothetical protein